MIDLEQHMRTAIHEYLEKVAIEVMEQEYKKCIDTINTRLKKEVDKAVLGTSSFYDVSQNQGHVVITLKKVG